LKIAKQVATSAGATLVDEPTGQRWRVAKLLGQTLADISNAVSETSAPAAPG
jgi:hypothetical protein